MYKIGVGYSFSEQEREAFDRAVLAFLESASGGLTGDRQRRFAELIKAAQPAFSEGELRCAVRMFIAEGD